MIGFSEVIQNIIYFISLYYVIFWVLVLLDSEEDIPKKKWKEYPEVSVIIPAYNEADNIVETLKSAMNLDYPKGKLKIIFVDDGSKDDTYNLAKEYIKKSDKSRFKEIIVLTQKNKGKYAAVNHGLKHVDTEFFATLDADSIPNKNALLKIMGEFTDKNIAGVSPVLKVYKPKNFLQTIQYFEYNVNHYYKHMIKKVNAIHVLPGPLSTYRTAIVRKVGGFREAHKTEDMELAMRLQMKHYTIVQCEEAFVYTKTPYTLKQLYTQRHRWNYGTFKNLIDYRKMIFNKKYGDFGLFQLPMIVVSGFLGLIIVGLISYDVWKRSSPTFKLLSAYNFNLWAYFKDTTINFVWLDVDLRALVTLVIFFSITMIILYMSLKMYKEKYKLRHSVAFILYLFFYYLFLAVVWIGVFKAYLLGTKTKWKKAN